MTLWLRLALAALVACALLIAVGAWMERRHARVKIEIATGADLDLYGRQLGFHRFVETDADFRARMSAKLRRVSPVAPLVSRSCPTCGTACEGCRPAAEGGG